MLNYQNVVFSAEAQVQRGIPSGQAADGVALDCQYHVRPAHPFSESPFLERTEGTGDERLPRPDRLAGGIAL